MDFKGEEQICVEKHSPKGEKQQELEKYHWFFSEGRNVFWYFAGKQKKQKIFEKEKGKMNWISYINISTSLNIWTDRRNGYDIA